MITRTETKRLPMHTYISATTKKRVEILAKKHGITQTTVINNLLKAGLTTLKTTTTKKTK